MKNTKSNTFINILISVLYTALVAYLSSIFNKSNSAWYLSLNKPSNFIPDIAFPIVWSTIYVMFAVTIFTLLQNNKMTPLIITLFISNGVFQVLWTLAYFTMQQLLIGLILIVITTILSIALVRSLACVSRKYLYLSIYPLWLILATALNLSTWILN